MTTIQTKQAKSQSGASLTATTKKKPKKATAKDKTEPNILITESNCESTIATKFVDKVAEAKRTGAGQKCWQTSQGSGETVSKSQQTSKSNNVGSDVAEDGANKLLEEFLNQQIQNVHVGNQLLEMENKYCEENKKHTDEERDWKKDMHIIHKQQEKLMIKQLKMEMEIKALETYQKMKSKGMDIDTIQKFYL